MSEFNRPDRHRLSRVHNRIEKALDELSRANGEMRPTQFRTIKGHLDAAMERLEALQHDLVKHMAGTDGALPPGGDESGDDDDVRPRRGRAAAE